MKYSYTFGDKFSIAVRKELLLFLSVLQEIIKSFYLYFMKKAFFKNFRESISIVQFALKILFFPL